MEQDLVEVQRHIDRGRQDIVYFAWHFLGIKLHPGQIRFLRGADAQVNVLVPGNRFGKTVLIAVRHIWHNYYKKGWSDSQGDEWVKVKYRTAAIAPNSKILVLDYNLIMDIMQSKFVISPKGQPIVTNKCRIGHFLIKDSCKTTPTPFIQFDDNAGIQFYSTSEDKGSSVQGDFFGYGSYDEGGRSHHLKTELEQNLGPRFSELNAPMDLVSTPYMDSPSLLHHHDIFEKGLRGEEGYRSFEGSAYENVFLPPWYFEREEARLKGSPARDQVLFGKFVFAGSQLFPADDINACKDDSMEPLGAEMGHSYIIGVDTAMGEDEMVYTVLDITNPKKIRLERIMGAKGNSKSPQVHMDDFIGLVETYRMRHHLSQQPLNRVRIILETWNGESARFYQDLPYTLQFLTKCFGSWQPQGVKIIGRNPKNVKKAEILIALRKLLAQRSITIPSDPDLIKQLSIYREDDKNLPTDRVMSLALACWLATDGKVKNATAELVQVEL